jgi:hypothetical protein
MGVLIYEMNIINSLRELKVKSRNYFKQILKIHLFFLKIKKDSENNETQLLL